MNSVTSERLIRFRELEAALDEARAAEVPTYAPEGFARAMKAVQEARRAVQECASGEQLRRQLQQARKALDEATQVAQASRELLSPVVERRSEAQRMDWVRHYAPRTLYEAEAYAQKAVCQAESGDANAAAGSAAEAQRLYREAALQALERGPIGNLDSQVKYAARSLPRKRHERAAGELVALRDILERTRSGELDLSMLRDEIGRTGREIGRLLAPGDGFGPDPDFLSPPAIGGWAPGTFGPPDAPLTIRVTERTATSLTVTWRDRSGFEDVNQIERQQGDGPWETVAGYGPLSDWPTHTDTGLQPDTLYCYRVRVANGFGSSVMPPGAKACAYTRDGNDIGVWRVQLKIRTTDVSDAGTKDDVRVSLNVGNHTWLDYGPRRVSAWPEVWFDDFHRGTEFTYDLNLTAISEFGDINRILIVKEGTDAWGIAELSLWVNGAKAFERTFGETASTCLWIDQGDGYSPSYAISHAELRAHALWQAFVEDPPRFRLEGIDGGLRARIPNDEIVSRLESMIGHRIHNTPLYWGNLHGSEWVEVTRVDDHTLHVDVDLTAEITGPNPEVDMDFDLKLCVECDGDEGMATMTVTTQNFGTDAEFSLLQDIVTLGIVEFFDDDVEKEIRDSWSQITQSISLDTDGVCPTLEVDNEGNINLIILL